MARRQNKAMTAILLVHPEQDYMTVSDLSNDQNLSLINMDHEIESLKEDYGEQYKDQLSEYGCFFVEVGEGEYTRIYGCSSSVAWMKSTVTRLKTPSQIVDKIVRVRNSKQSM